MGWGARSGASRFGSLQIEMQLEYYMNFDKTVNNHIIVAGKK